MPKLLQINVTANWGSTGKIAESIGLSAINQGWESYIAYGRYSNPSRSQMISIGTLRDTYWHYGVQRILDNEGLNSTKATKKLVKKMQEIKPDVVQLHNIHDHYLNYRILFEYLNQTNIKVVWTFHDCWAFTGHCFHFVTKGCEKWKTGCYHCPLRNEYPKTILDNSSRNYEWKKQLFTANQNLTIVPCSEWMEGFVKESFLKNKKIITIHNGVDIDIFAPISTLQRKDKFRIIAVSSVWTKSKGLYDIYKLREMLPSEIEIMMVGLSEKQLKTLPKGIDGIQRTQNVQELVQLYNEADVLINPTYADTFPTVNLEALACGTPVITYQTGGSPEALDEKTGFVIPQGDVNGLFKAILKVQDGKINREDCRKRAVSLYDKNSCFSKYIDCFFI
jgi:glycosyltransferase involved in cell wall biosynthesis